MRFLIKNGYEKNAKMKKRTISITMNEYNLLIYYLTSI